MSGARTHARFFNLTLIDSAIGNANTYHIVDVSGITDFRVTLLHFSPGSMTCNIGGMLVNTTVPTSFYQSFVNNLQINSGQSYVSAIYSDFRYVILDITAAMSMDRITGYVMGYSQ